jgi:subtilase family serine protease
MGKRQEWWRVVAMNVGSSWRSGETWERVGDGWAGSADMKRAGGVQGESWAGDAQGEAGMWSVENQIKLPNVSVVA